MSVFTVDEPEPPREPVDEPARRPLVYPRPVPDPALRNRVLVDGEPQSPATVHIRRKEAA